MNDKYNSLIQILGESRVKKNENLKNYTSLKIGGNSDLFFKATTQKDFILALTTAKQFKIPCFVLGGGTNILFSDEGFNGLVVKNETSSIRFKGLAGKRMLKNNNQNLVSKVFLEVESGVTINRLVRITVDQGLGGLENFLGQPGTVGGAVYINAHNIKSNIHFGDLILTATIFDQNKGVIEVPQRFFHFSYDYSVVQKSKDIILSVTLELISANKDDLWNKAKAALLYRNTTQPEGINSAGCLFRNIDKSEALRLGTPNYTCSAGYLMDAVGLKGMKIGAAALSKKHANFLQNLGSASSNDVIELINLAKTKVKKKFGVDLTPEIVIVS